MSEATTFEITNLDEHMKLHNEHIEEDTDILDKIIKKREFYQCNTSNEAMTYYPHQKFYLLSTLNQV